MHARLDVPQGRLHIYRVFYGTAARRSTLSLIQRRQHLVGSRLILRRYMLRILSGSNRIVILDLIVLVKIIKCPNILMNCATATHMHVLLASLYRRVCLES